MKYQICHFNLKWTLSLRSHLCIGCVCVFFFFLGVLCSDGTAHVSKELEVGAFISKSDSVPQQSMEHFASDLLREWGWNWMIACCVTGQVTGGCISELEGRQSYMPSPCVLLPVPRYWIPSWDQKQFEALQQHHYIFMPLSAFISTECIKFGCMSVDITGPSGLYTQHMHCSKCKLIYVCELSTQKSTAPYAFWFMQDHKRNFDVTRLAPVLEKGCEIV